MSEQQLEVKEFDHPPFAEKLAQDGCHYLLGQAASILTQYSSIYAGVWFVTETTDSALMLALASLVVLHAAAGLARPLGGVVADRSIASTCSLPPMPSVEPWHRSWA